MSAKKSSKSKAAPAANGPSKKEARPRLAIRLAELLNYTPHLKKRPGIIRDIVTHTGLDRHQVSALLTNRVKYIPLDTLFRLYEYLIEHAGVPAQLLLGALFAFQPQDFWELLARRRKIDFCLAVRQPEKTEWSDGALIVASDSLLMGELLKGMSTLGGAAKFRTRSTMLTDENAPHFDQEIPHPEIMGQPLVWAPRRDTNEIDIELARQVYDPFQEFEGDQALVCLGSNKSNPVFELIIAGAFQCDPFVSQADVENPTLRAAPFFIAYRDSDPQPVSCLAGQTLARGMPKAEPGIWYETESGEWELCPWSESRDDVALVFYRYWEGTGKLEMVLGGFSGRATRLLAKTLEKNADKLWPPTYSSDGLQIGAFILRYKFTQQDYQQRDILRTELPTVEEVMPISGDVIARHLERAAEKNLRRPPAPAKPR